jgi:threonine synthase
VLGDPTYHRLQQALERGALPFTCQGNQNGLAIEGGETLGYELVSQLTAAGQHLDRLFVQVGGGALASAVAQALAEARELGVLERLPRLHAVQTRGAYPLVRAYERVAAYLTQRLGPSPATPHALAEPTDPQERADRLQALLRAADAPRELAWIAHHRSAFMWPWETEPHSVAGGILDDETYDWWAVVRAMLASGGYPVVVDEPVLREANTLAVETTGIDVDPTGSAGLAGLIELRRQGLVEAHEAIGLLFTGVRRSGPTPHPHTTPGGPS